MKNVSGIISEIGGTNSHVSIIARNKQIPMIIITVVTIVLVATEIVETISPSLLPCFTFACSLALTAQGTFKFTKLPVKNPKYVPLVPSNGEYVITSTNPPIINLKLEILYRFLMMVNICISHPME